MAQPLTATLTAEVRKRFPGFELDAAFSVPPGVTMLFGASGSGKTTLLNCIAGLLRPDCGRVEVADRKLFDSSAGVDVPVNGRSIGYLSQSLDLFPHLTVEGNVAYGLARLPARERRDRVCAMLESLRIPHLALRRPKQISGGEQRRVALARALVTEPAVLLLDEPLSALDLPAQSRLISDLRAWNDSHRTPVLYVTHSQREVFALGERVIVLDEGRVMAEGTPQNVLRAPRQEQVAELAGVENIFDTKVTAVHEAHGTMTCRLAGSPVELEVPLGRQASGASVRVAIRAGDILVAGELPSRLSARNILPGTVTGLRRTGVTVHLEVECGVRFQVKLTPGACQSLGLLPGSAVWLVIKTYSCHLLHAGGQENDL
jgi:molybdate transport system ATP-binding protein